jgi:hypothetical protein
MKRFRIVSLSLLMAAGVIWVLLEFRPREDPRAGPPGGGAAEGAASPDPTIRGRRARPEDESPATDPERDRVPVSAEPDATLLVRVTDRQSGRAVDGAAIEIDPSGSAPGAGVLANAAGAADGRTDELGEALFPVTSGIRMRLRVRDRGPAVARVERSVPALVPGERREILVELPRGLDLDHWLRAVAAESESGVAAARVRLLLAGTPDAQSGSVAASDAPPAEEADAEGLVELRVPSWRAAYARIDAPGRGPRIAALVPGHDEPSRPQVVPLARGARLAATLASAPGVPLAGASLVLSVAAPDLAIPRGSAVPSGDLERSALTDEHGVARFDDLPPEVPVRAEIRRGGELLQRVADPWTFAPGEDARREVCLGLAARVRGALLGAGSAPVPGVPIWLARAAPGSRGAEGGPEGDPKGDTGSRYFRSTDLERPFAVALTGPDGRFVFEGLEAGDWWVGPAPVRAAPTEPAGNGGVAVIAPRASLVVLAPGVPEVEVLLRADAGLWIRGRVLGPGDVAVAQTVVEARAADALGAPSTRTDGDGSFAIGPLAPGDFRVRARGRFDLADSAETTAKAGDRDLVLRLSTGATLRGRAVDRASGAPRVATIHLARTDAEEGAGERTAALASAGRDGSFQFRALVPGTYALVARGDDGAVGFLRDVAVRLGEPASPVIVALAPGASLRIRYGGTQAWGRYVVRAGGTVLTDGTLRAGESVLVRVPPGAVTVRFETPTEPAEERPVAVGAGENEVAFGPGQVPAAK